MPTWLGMRDVVQILVLLAAMGTTYFNLVERVSVAENNMANYKERIIKAEHDIQQETIGYRNIQAELSNRLEILRKDAQTDRLRIETKLDALKDLLLKEFPRRSQ